MEHRAAMSSVEPSCISDVCNHNRYSHGTGSTLPLSIRMQQCPAKDFRFSAAGHQVLHQTRRSIEPCRLASIYHAFLLSTIMIGMVMLPDRLSHSSLECSSVAHRTFDLVLQNTDCRIVMEHRAAMSSVEPSCISIVYDHDRYGHGTRSTLPVRIRMQQCEAQDLRFSVA